MDIRIGQPARVSRFCAIIFGGACLILIGMETSAQEKEPPSKVPPPPVKSESGPQSVTAQKVPLSPTTLDLSKFPAGWVQYTADKKNSHQPGLASHSGEGSVRCHSHVYR